MTDKQKTFFVCVVPIPGQKFKPSENQIMKFTLIACEKGNEKDPSKHWEENYEKDLDPGEDIEKICRGYVTFFNNTLRPHEKARSFISCKLDDSDSSSLHRWEKDARQMSITRKVAGEDCIVDGFYCVKCGIRGHRVGLRSTISRDHKFRAKRFADCSVAKKEKVGNQSLISTQTK